jgi:hypothetical protein
MYGNWTGTGKSNLRIEGGGADVWSYRTRIVETLPGGRTVGNVTKYSATTSRHQSKARVWSCDIFVTDIPEGTYSLAEYANDPKHVTQRNW